MAMRVSTASLSVLAASTLVACALVAGCTPSGSASHFQKPTAAAIAGLGVPVYPGAKPGRVMSETKMFGTDAVSIAFETHDPAPRVAAFYASRLPQARRLNFHIGGFQTYVFQYYAGARGGVATKQVTIAEIAGLTEIQITSSVLAMPQPTPSPT